MATEDRLIAALELYIQFRQDDEAASERRRKATAEMRELMRANQVRMLDRVGNIRDYATLEDDRMSGAQTRLVETTFRTKEAHARLVGIELRRVSALEGILHKLESVR